MGKAVARYLVLICAGVYVFFAGSCQHKSYELPLDKRTGDPSLCFDRDILPIFLSQCATSGCHDKAEHEKGYILDSYENIVKKGIAPGNPIGSRIYESILGYTEERMPAEAPPLSDAQISLIERWIRAGAIKDDNCANTCDSNNFTFASGVKPIIEQYCVSCHGSSNPQGNISLNNYILVKAAILNQNLLKCINYESGYPAMPQGIQLTSCEVRQIEKWVAAGMPDN